MIIIDDQPGEVPEWLMNMDEKIVRATLLPDFLPQSPALFLTLFLGFRRFCHFFVCLSILHLLTLPTRLRLGHRPALGPRDTGRFADPVQRQPLGGDRERPRSRASARQWPDGARHGSRGRQVDAVAPTLFKSRVLRHL